VYQIAAHLPECPPDIETHDVQPEEAGKKCEVGDEPCKKTKHIAGTTIAGVFHLKYELHSYRFPTHGSCH
jgi:hypothetical protein